jgi:hypothetical protein
MTPSLRALEAIRQLHVAGYLSACVSREPAETGLRGVMDHTALPRLHADTRFACGLFYGLHRDVGQDLCDFRADRGTFGKGSLQIVLDKQTGNFWCDVDAWSPYTDVVNVIGHMFGEVIPGWWRGWR